MSPGMKIDYRLALLCLLASCGAPPRSIIATSSRRLVDAIVKAAEEANSKLSDAEFSYRLGHESSVGQNSRLLLKDDTIFWIGDRSDAVRPTGPFDPELPVLAFRDGEKKLVAAIFNHSTHT